MPKYLFKVSLSSAGVQGVLKRGGTDRREAVTELVESVGGTLEALYFGFGGTDVYVLLDAPDNVAAAAASMTASATGVVSVETVVLLTPEELDAVSKRKVVYRPPVA